ncbi:hypothetical protein HB774_02620 [Rhizobium leguminosarum bv. viciae]|nr:hypothetical protein HB774_02620 [Rhizobium leguminosarum bv. viciae]
MTKMGPEGVRPLLESEAKNADLRLCSNQAVAVRISSGAPNFDHSRTKMGTNIADLTCFWPLRSKH